MQITDTHVTTKTGVVALGLVPVGKDPKKTQTQFVQTINTINKQSDELDFVILTGDIVDYSHNTGGPYYESSKEEWVHPSWANLNQFEYIADFSEVPIFAVIGNHEWYDGGDGDGLDIGDDEIDVLRGFQNFIADDFLEMAEELGASNFRFRKGTEFTIDYKESSNYGSDWSFDYGYLHIVGLLSGQDDEWETLPNGSGLSEDQIKWLEKDLEGKKNIYIFMHHPFFRGDGGTTGCFLNYRDDFANLLSKHDVEGVYSGHTHAPNEHYNYLGVDYHTTRAALYGSYRIIEPETLTPYLNVLGIPAPVQYSDSFEPIAEMLWSTLPLTGPDNKKVIFELDGNYWTGFTDSGLVAGNLYQINKPPGKYTLTAKFEGDGYLEAVEDSTQIEVLKENSTLDYTGWVEGEYSDHLTLKARLGEPDGWIGDLSDKEITFKLGEYSWTTKTDSDGVASATIAIPNPSGEHILEAKFEGDENYQGSSDSTIFSVSREDDIDIEYQGDNSGQYSDFFTMWARFWETDETVGDLGEKEITFELGGYSWTATTSDNGITHTANILPLPAGVYDLRVRFEGDSYYVATGKTYLNKFEVLKENTILTYTGATEGQYGARVVLLEATLTEPERVRATWGDLSNKRIVFELDGDYWVAYTDNTGVASTEVQIFKQPGTYTITASFAGDNYYVGSSDNAIFTVF
jgi:predicted MPP superfamily phosphohydrolase